MIRILMLLTAAALSFVSCSSEPTMQKYLVEKADARDFIAIDASSSILKNKSVKFTAEEREAIDAIKGINVLVFKATKDNKAAFESESTAAKGLLKTDGYEPLVKINSNGIVASINTKGEGDKIDEFVVYAQQPETGFGVIRITGDNITPNTVMTVAAMIQKTGINAEQFKPLEQLVKSKQ